MRWQVPFESRKGTRYRVDIYDKDWSGSATVLTGAEDVITTDEENNDNFFEPVRTQTGTLRVVDVDGSLMEQLVPDNNTHRFVELKNETNGRVEWQGFLSSDVYSQGYTARTQIIDLTVNSVLATMDSVQLDNGVASQFKKVQLAIADVLGQMETEAGKAIFDYVYFPRNSTSILGKYFNMSTFFDKQMQCNEDSVVYTIKGISSQEMLERICQFMGWTVRESGRSIYFEAPDDMLGMVRTTFPSFKGGLDPSRWGCVTYVNNPMPGLEYTGEDHQKSVSQGAKSVEVIANLSDFEMDMELPGCPVGNLEEIYGSFVNLWWYMLCNKNEEAYSNLRFRSYSANLRIFYNQSRYIAESNVQNVIDHMVNGSSSALEAYNYPGDWVTFHAGAFLSKEVIEEEWHAAHKTQDALHCVFFPRMINNQNVLDTVEPIFTIDNLIMAVMSEGYIKLSADAMFAQIDLDNTVTVGEVGRRTTELLLSLQFGDKYWNGSRWTTAESRFTVYFEGRNFEKNWTPEYKVEETDGYLIPITSMMYGTIKLSVWPMINRSYAADGTKYAGAVEATFFSLSADHVTNTNSRKIERKENHYFRLLGTKFSDAKLIDFQMGSDLNNLPSPSTPMEDVETPITLIPFLDKDGQEVIKRPELNLLDRACAYYEKARRQIDLVAEHPGDALPTMRITGYDGRTYVPLSESRDWAGDSSVIRCFETPD